MLPAREIRCPYCGEPMELQIDAAGNQDYIEDCHVCCRPIEVAVRIGFDGAIDVQTRADDAV